MTVEKYAANAIKHVLLVKVKRIFNVYLANLKLMNIFTVI